MEGCRRLEVLDAQHSDVPAGASARLHLACPALRTLLQTDPRPAAVPAAHSGKPRAFGVWQHMLLSCWSAVVL